MTRRDPPAGVLFVNLGTPDSPRPSDVRRYLREFLSDPRVIDIAAVPRWLLLNLVILPLRPRQSAEAYRKVWTDEGSPLLANARAFCRALQSDLGPGFDVELAMRYGEPSIEAAMKRLADRGRDRIVVLPAYAHEASSSTGSSLEAVYRTAGRPWDVPHLAVVPPYFDDAGFVSAQAGVARPVIERTRPDHVLFSYHGLPERQVRKSDPSGAWCLASADCCAKLQDVNRRCYRAQCFETSRLLVRELELEVPWTVCFQSRLGRTPWIRPFTDELLESLPKEGVRRLVVVSGSFVQDCLETLEELGIRGRESFLEAGGEQLELVASLNAEPAWVSAAAELVRRTAWSPARPEPAG